MVLWTQGTHTQLLIHMTIAPQSPVGTAAIWPLDVSLDISLNVDVDVMDLIPSGEVRRTGEPAKSVRS